MGWLLSLLGAVALSLHGEARAAPLGDPGFHGEADPEAQQPGAMARAAAAYFAHESEQPTRRDASCDDRVSPVRVKDFRADYDEFYEPGGSEDPDPGDEYSNPDNYNENRGW